MTNYIFKCKIISGTWDCWAWSPLLQGGHSRVRTPKAPPFNWKMSLIK